jgi:predicted nucleotidyltransferase
MTSPQLSGRDIDLLDGVFRRYIDIERVVLFGSRAKGTARSNSDIDLAIIGLDDDMSVEALAQELDELPMPYQFDVKSMTSIRNVQLRHHIERVGVEIFNRHGNGVT